MDLSDFRENYLKRKLEESDLPADPFSLFEKWFGEVVSLGIEDPTAMALSTCDANGKPSSRMVLLKGIDKGGFIFYTNYMSRKSADLTANPQASLLFYWKDLQCQVRIEGKVSQLSPLESDLYFYSRPVESRIAAIVSPQSQVIPDRSWLETKARKYREEHPEGPVQCPPFWGGYLLLPEMFEFWQGRENRLHDRFRYSTKGIGWKRERLAP